MIFGNTTRGVCYCSLATAIQQSSLLSPLPHLPLQKVSDPAPYLDLAFKVFGFERVMYESNWFVSRALGDDYDKTFRLVKAALARAGASAEQMDAVFSGNARRVYRL